MYSHWLVFVAPPHRSVRYRKAPQPRVSSCPAMQKRQSEKMSIHWVALWEKETFDRDESEGSGRAQLSQLDYYIVSWWRSHVCLWKMYTCDASRAYVRGVWLWSLCNMDDEPQGVEIGVGIATRVDIKMLMKYFNPGWLICGIMDALSIHLKNLHQNVFTFTIIKSSLSSGFIYFSRVSYISFLWFKDKCKNTFCIHYE